MTTATADSGYLLGTRPDWLNARARLVLAIPMLVVGTLMLMTLDHRLSHAFREYGVATWIDNADHSTVGWIVGQVLRVPGEGWPTIACAAILLIFHKQTWRAGGLVMLAFVPGAINGILKWVAGRQRPFTGQEPWDWDCFRGGLSGLFHQKNLSFASGHTTMAFAWATAMAILFPRFRAGFFLLATLCGLQRILSNDHYLTDVVVGAALGVVTVKVLFRILSRVVAPAREGPQGNPSRISGQQTGESDIGNGINDRPQPALPLAGHSLLQRAGERPDAAQAG